MKLVIINYGSGNLHSVHKAFEAVNNNLENPYEIIVTNTPSEILNADKLVLPGVGAFQDCKNAIHKIDGLFESLEQVVIGEKKAFMGICVGMQLLAEKSLEFGECEGFGWIPGEVIKIEAPADYKIPHMGWNEVTFRNHELLNNISQNTDFILCTVTTLELKKMKIVLQLQNIQIQLLQQYSRKIFLVHNFIQKKVIITENK